MARAKIVRREGNCLIARNSESSKEYRIYPRDKADAFDKEVFYRIRTNTLVDIRDGHLKPENGNTQSKPRRAFLSFVNFADLCQKIFSEELCSEDNSEDSIYHTSFLTCLINEKKALLNGASDDAFEYILNAQDITQPKQNNNPRFDRRREKIRYFNRRMGFYPK